MEVKWIVNEIDEKVFVFIINVYEVIGEGFIYVKFSK